MKQVHFYLKNQEDTYYDGFVDATKSNQKISFKVKDFLYIVDLEQNIISRKNEESLTTIDIKNNLITIELRKENYVFDFPINIIKFERDKQVLYLEYQSSEENIVYLKIRY